MREAMDRADGELARLSGKSSRFGAIYDLVTDAICNAALFIGLGVAAMNGELGGWGLLMGVVAGIGNRTGSHFMSAAHPLA